MGWLGTIKEALSAPTVETRPPDAGYEVIAGDEHDELVLSTGSLPPRIQDDKRVYQAFWVLGAGVLLSWNGRFFVQVSGRSVERSLMCHSADMYVSFHGNLLRRRL